MMGEWSDVGWWGMGVAMIAWVLVLAFIVGLVVWAMNRSERANAARGSDSGEEVLRRRFAGGEIDADEYQRRLAVLRS